MPEGIQRLSFWASGDKKTATRKFSGSGILLTKSAFSGKLATVVKRFLNNIDSSWTNIL